MPNRSLARSLEAQPLAFVLAGAAVLHAVAFDYGLISDDEAIHATEARVMMGGGVMYRDIAEHRPPEEKGQRQHRRR